MKFQHRIIGLSTVVVFLSVLTALQLQAQSPTATPTTVTDTVTPTPNLATATPLPATPLAPRQAVVKTPLDGDSVEVVFTDNGQIATVHLANVKAPNSIGEIECFGREAAEYALQSYQSNPLILIEPTGEIENDEVSAYITLADGTLLNKMLVLFGYARFDGQGVGIYADQIQTAEEQSKKGKTGLWRVCGETAQAPKPCFLFNNGEMDSISKRKALAQLESVSEISAYFRYAYYDSVQNEVIVTWQLGLDRSLGNDYMDEYYRLPECLLDRSVLYQK